MRVFKQVVILSFLLLPMSSFSETTSSAASSSSSPASSAPSTGQSSSSAAALTSSSLQKVEKLEKIYDQKGYSNAKEIAEIAVKHDLDRNNLSANPNLNKKIWLDNMEIDGLRFYKKSGKKFPWQIKCSEYDKRVMHFCFESEYFQPALKAYFDRGGDEDGRVDLFSNGAMNVSLDFASLYVPLRFGRSEYFDSWAWGPQVSVGISAANKDQEAADEASEKSSGAPIVVASYGLLLRYRKDVDSASFGLEFGQAHGFTTDESYANNRDKAIYVGLKVNIPLSSKPK